LELIGSKLPSGDGVSDSTMEMNPSLNRRCNRCSGQVYDLGEITLRFLSGKIDSYT
jgi:excinuclease UvrABC ATPase subunit